MIRGEIKEHKLDRKSITKREKFEVKSKLILIYDSKLQSNDRREKIRRKIHNLSRDSIENDPIDGRIKGFLLRNFEEIIGFQEAISSYYFNEISLLTDPWTQELVYKQRVKRFKDFGV